MKKVILSLFCLFFALPALFALEVADNYTHNSKFWKNSAAMSIRPYYALKIGAEFDITEHDNFANNIYALRLPITLNISGLGLILKPFYYPDNANNASAWGGKMMLVSKLSEDEINETLVQAYIGGGFGSQKADVLRNGSLTSKDTFSQLAYELGLNIDFFNQFSFEAGGNAFQYLSGISNVQSVGGVLNQQELADLGTLDYVLGLPRASGGAKMRWRSVQSRSDNYISYRYIDFYRQKAAHSLMASSTIAIFSKLFLNISYNHLFIAGSTDKDLYGGGIMLKF
ncbi:MAG: hypothetical protein LBM71_04530 [Elusimicrobiota bacterium]|jgi:hypothetical protein|nr:hypothetical protein [Elusimicrobiota bacterium]